MSETGWPVLPLPVGRRTSATDTTILGKDADLRSPQTAVQGNSLLLDDAQRTTAPPLPTPPPLYALYRFNVPDTDVFTIDVHLDPTLTSGAYIGLPNYDTQRWEFSDESLTDFSQPRALTIDPARHVSPAGNLFVAVLERVPGGLVKVDQLVLHGNRLPQPQVNAFPDTGPAPLVVDFDPTGSTDPDGNVVEYRWDWEGDGTMDWNTVPAAPGVQHTFDTPGVYTVRMTAVDNEGGTKTVTTTITVSP